LADAGVNVLNAGVNVCSLVMRVLLCALWTESCGEGLQVRYNHAYSTRARVEL